MREADTGNYKATWKWRLGRVEWEEKWEKIKNYSLRNQHRKQPKLEIRGRKRLRPLLQSKNE